MEEEHEGAASAVHNIWWVAPWCQEVLWINQMQCNLFDRLIMTKWRLPLIADTCHCSQCFIDKFNKLAWWWWCSPCCSAWPDSARNRTKRSCLFKNVNYMAVKLLFMIHTFHSHYLTKSSLIPYYIIWMLQIILVMIRMWQAFRFETWINWQYLGWLKVTIRDSFLKNWVKIAFNFSS